MLIHYSVQLRRNFGEIPVQIKRFHTDLIATHPIAVSAAGASNSAQDVEHAVGVLHSAQSARAS